MEALSNFLSIISMLFALLLMGIHIATFFMLLLSAAGSIKMMFNVKLLVKPLGLVLFAAAIASMILVAKIVSTTISPSPFGQHDIATIWATIGWLVLFILLTLFPLLVITFTQEMLEEKFPCKKLALKKQQELQAIKKYPI